MYFCSMENTTSNPLRWLLSAVVCTALVLAGCSSSSVKKQAWVTTWATAVQLVEPYNLPPAPGLEGNKLRQIVQVSIGGEAVQLRLSNEYGTADMEITSVELAEALDWLFHGAPSGIPALHVGRGLHKSEGGAGAHDYMAMAQSAYRRIDVAHGISLA